MSVAKLSVVLPWALLLPITAYAQAQGSLTGVVRDSSGAVLPGVTVEASSPVLIEKSRNAVTDSTGQYRFVNLFPGTYTLTFTLAGFNSVRREGLEVTGSFVATVNVEMRIGALEETITVTGETPIVDVQSTTRQRVLAREVMDAVPTSRIPYELAVLVPGVTARNGPGTAAVQDVGGSAGNQQANSLVVHGSKPVDMRLTYNGLTLATLETGKNAGAINNSTALQEITVDSSAVSAELSTGGVRINLIPREGGNTFKGTFFGSFTNSSLQGNNYTQELKNRGLTTPDSIKTLWDINPGFGGPLKKDTLWFYLSARHNGWKNNVGGTFYNANAGNPNAWTYVADTSRPGASDNVWKDAQIRLTWQATPRNKIAGTFNQQDGSTYNGGSATASPESVYPSHYDPKRNTFADWTVPVTNRLLFEAVGVVMSERLRPVFPTEPLVAVTEQVGGRTYRGNAGLSNNFWNTNYYYRASLSYITGAHAFKVGFNNGGGERKFSSFTGQPMSFRFNNGVPNQITLRATPYVAISNLDADAGIYAQDKWTLNRLTLNLGVRYDYYQSSFPEQHVGSAPLVPGRDVTIPAQPGVRGWHDVTPKLGVAYDLFGTGKTAVKGTVNKYVQGQALGGDLPDRPFGYPLNPVYRIVNSTTRSWNDSNRNFAPDCDLTNPLTNGECGPMANSNFGKPQPDTTYDPAILGGWGKRAGYNWEFSAAIQHEIVPHVSVDVGYFRRLYGNLLLTDNLAVASSDYNPFSITAPVDPRLPGGGGYLVTGLYDLTPAKFGLPVNNLRTYSDNYGKQIEHWNGVDASVNARVRGVLFQGGLSTGRTITDNCQVVSNVPEVMFGILGNAATVWTPAQYCHYQTPFLSQYKLLGMYTLPRWDVQVSATFQSVPGPEIIANYNVPTAVAAQSLGRPLSGGAANTTVNLIAPGSMYGDRHNQLDFRLGKIVKVARTRTTINVDLYNALNASPVLTENPNFTAFRQPTSILLARFLKLGLQFDF
jgi:hypothetical protein